MYGYILLWIIELWYSRDVQIGPYDVRGAPADGKCTKTMINVDFSSYSVSQVLQPHGASNPPGPPPSNVKPTVPGWKRPTHPPVRIDTCIVGDDTTCDAAQHERCRTELGVSSCLCRPGYSRRKHRDPCHS